MSTEDVAVLAERVETATIDVQAQIEKFGRDALAKIDALQTERHLMRAVARRACVLALAAISTYGRRDANGLCGLSRKHWQEITEMEQKFCLYDADLTALESTDGR